jgi:hypothetical protein
MKRRIQRRTVVLPRLQGKMQVAAQARVGEQIEQFLVQILISRS